MRNMVLSIGLAALAVGVEADEPARQAAALVSNVNGVSACSPWGCGLNSPVVASATLVAPPASVRQSRRHQAAQIACTDVVLDEAGTEARQNRIGDSRNMRSAVRDTRFGEAYTNAASSLKNGQQLTPSQIKVLVMPLLEQRFGETWGKNLNSPVIDGATIL